jgi:hypothetical protein
MEILSTSATLQSRNWQDQPLPAPLISYDQAEIVALGLLRQQRETHALVGAGLDLVQQTLENAGVPTTLLALHGRALVLPNLVLQTNPEAAILFDELHASVLTGPQDSDPDSATWLRQRRLAQLRALALGSREAMVFLPDVDALWQPVTALPRPIPSVGKWIAQATLLLLVSAGALLAYIYNAGPGPALWPLLAMPLVGALAFGGMLFSKLSTYRQQVAMAWLTRPARLRPDSAAVAKNMAKRPWVLFYLPLVLLPLAFAVLIALLASGQIPSLSLMLWPIAVAFVLLLVSAYLLANRYVHQTRAVVQDLPTPLLPEGLQQLWQSYLYY